MKLLILIYLFLNFFILIIKCQQQSPSFCIKDGNFLYVNSNNGNQENVNQYQIISGSFHYFRCLPQLWMDRLLKIKACGLNTIQTYIPWNVLQPNGNDSELIDDGLISFLNQVKQVGLNIILRPGPYACAEWEFGGLPYWLLKDNPDIALRSSDPNFLNAVSNYWSKLLPLLQPYLFTNGGPIIMVQVENEYGSYGSDKVYIQYLHSLLEKYLGNGGGDGNGVLFHSTDGPSVQMLYGSNLNGTIYQTVDFGPNSLEQIQQNFNIQQKFTTSPTPFMNSEYYTGWITHWGDSTTARTDPSVVADGLNSILSLNASVNMYMFYGGSNPGYMNGANSNSPTLDFEITIQSYDYDSPLTESGDTTEKYFMIKSVIEKYIGPIASSKLPPVPSNSTKFAYGTISITNATSLFDNLDVLVDNPSAQFQTGSPLSLEQLDQSTGFVLYETSIDFNQQSNQLTVAQLHDRSTFYINDQVSINSTNNQPIYLQRPFNSTVQLDYTGSQVCNLKILLESQGRVNFGPYLNDKKGLLSGGVMSGGQQYLGPWNNYPLPLENATNYQTDLSWESIESYEKSNSPTFYQTTLYIPNSGSIGDTFLSFNGLGKGQLFVNGYNVGKYWNIGPQRTIYISSVLLKQGSNNIILFETLLTDKILEIQFLNQPIFD